MKNIYGQSAVHLAVKKPACLKLLIQSDHIIDAVDNNGFTPLVYAAIENQKESSIMLLRAGAELENSCHYSNFIFYACLRHNWALIIDCLVEIRAMHGEQSAKLWTRELFSYFPRIRWDSARSLDENQFQSLLVLLGSNLNFTFDDCTRRTQNMTLLHLVRSVQDVDALLNAGFKSGNHVNNHGQNALIAVMERYEGGSGDVIQRLVDIGQDINLRDKYHSTALRCSLGRSLRWDWHITHLLLANGADAQSKDSCRCPCSPAGCLDLPAMAHLRQFFDGEEQFFLAELEYLNILIECRDEETAKIAVLSYIRMMKFHELGMTHLCCQRPIMGQTWTPRYRVDMPEEDITDIIEEEEGFIVVLNDEMRPLRNQTYATLLNDWFQQISEKLWESWGKQIQLADEQGMTLSNNYPDENVIISRPGAF